MKGGSAMNQQEFHEKLKEAREIQDKAMKIAEESNALMDVDFKRSNEMFIKSMENDTPSGYPPKVLIRKVMRPQPNANIILPERVMGVVT